MIEYWFGENEDYNVVIQKYKTAGGVQDCKDYMLSCDMAKEICMLQRTERGRQARLYFINLEKKFNSPEAILDRLIHITSNYNWENFIDLLTNFRDTAKMFGNFIYYKLKDAKIKLLVSYINSSNTNRKDTRTSKYLIKNFLVKFNYISYIGTKNYYFPYVRLSLVKLSKTKIFINLKIYILNYKKV